MPKQTLVINDFSGGLNDNSDPRDIEINEFAEIQGVQLNQPGKLQFIEGEKASAAYLSMTNSGTIHSSDEGFGTHAYSVDYTLLNGYLTGSDVYVLTSTSNGKIDIRRDDSASDKQVIDSTASQDANVFYDANGHLRISDAFLGSNPSLWFGYINQDLFWNTDNDDFQQKRAEWVRVVQDLLPFDTSQDEGLGITLALDDMASANPDSTSIANTTSKIVLGYMKYSQGRGDWTGSFEFGATPVYLGEQEGPITEIPGMVQAYKEKLAFQLYVCKGTSASDGNNAASLLGDKRVIGVNIYFRKHGRDSWLLLKEFDLIKGKPHFWGIYNESTDGAKGIWAGTLSIAMTGGQSLEQYVDSSVTVTYNLNASIIDSDRSGFLRVFGFLQNPVYFEVPAGTSAGQFGHTSSQTFAVSIKNPSHGTSEIYGQVLDEELNVVKESAKVNITFSAGSLTAADIEGIYQEQADDIDLPS